MTFDNMKINKRACVWYKQGDLYRYMSKYANSAQKEIYSYANLQLICKENRKDDGAYKHCR